MEDNRPRLVQKAFIKEHPLGAAITDINIAAALLCCEGVEIAEIKINPRRRGEKIFVLKGDKQFLAKQAILFHKSQLDRSKISVGPDGMAIAALFAQKLKILKAGIKNEISGVMIGGSDG